MQDNVKDGLHDAEERQAGSPGQVGIGSGNNEFYAYDAAGNRALRRSTSGRTTTMTVYAFGLEEHLYSGTGTNQGNTYYYSLAGRLVGELTGTTPKTNIFLTDPLGSVLATFSNTAGTAALLGNQVYGPYGTQRYSSGGTMGTNKGFTGQYTDSKCADRKVKDELAHIAINRCKSQSEITMAESGKFRYTQQNWDRPKFLGKGIMTWKVLLQ
jgi:YD repeat-containing protein